MKVKRLLTLILTLCMILSGLPANVYALEGCDGVLDAGEIELESYIEWNSFKSKIDNVSRDVLEEIRAAEGRMIPEIYPVGDNKVVVKTDIGFYSFIRQEDGSYVNTGLKVRFAHFGNYSKGTLSWVTGSELKSGVSGSYSELGDCCCLITGVVDYGKYGDHFYVLCSAENDYSQTNSTHSNELDDKNSYVSISEELAGYVLYVVNANTDTGLATAWHSYFETSGYNSKVYSPYFGGDSMYGVFLRESNGSNEYNHELTVQEYDLTKGEIHTSLAQSVVLSYTANSNSATTLSGRFSDSYNNSVKIPRDDAYPYGDMKYGVGSDGSDYDGTDTYRYITSKYLANDKGERSYMAPAGIIAPGDYGNIIRYYAKKGDSSNAVINGFNQVMPITETQLSHNQQQVGATIVAKHARDYGIPFYGTLTINKKSRRGDYQLTINSSRTTDTDRDGNVYHDGIQVLHKNYTPKLGQDGKYILDTETTHTIGGGIDKNTSRLTFSNLSLGSDAKIEIYGVPVDESDESDESTAPLLETITNSKNSLGTYTTPIFNYGAVTVKFTAGSSASGRGQGYTISKLEFGDCGIDDTEIVYEPAPKVSVPHIGYSGLIEAEIPTIIGTERNYISETTSNTYTINNSVTNVKHNLSVPYKSGYTGHNAKVTVTLKPSASTYSYYYTIKIGDNEKSSSTSGQYTYTYTTYDFTDVVDVSAGTRNSNYSYLFPIEVDVNVEYRYYDNAGTEVRRYTVASQQTYTYNVRDLENHFTRLNISEFNVPNGMVIALNENQITGKGTTSWLNTQNNVVTLTIPGDATYGRYLKKEMSDVIDYTLQSKNLADATLISTYNSAKGDCTVTSTTSGNKTKYNWSSTPAKITGVGNSYIKIESGLSGSYKGSGYSSSATGLRDVSSVSPDSNITHLRSGVEMDWEPTSSDTVIISQNAPYPDNNYSEMEAPQGKIVTSYKVIRATGISDSFIKTYTYDDTNIATLGNKVVGKNTFKDTFTSINYVTNLPTTFRNIYNNANTWQTIGKLRVVNSDGTTSTIGPLKGDRSIDYIEADLSYTSKTGSNTASMNIIPDEGYGKQVISYVDRNNYSYAVNLEEAYGTWGTFYGRFMLGNKVKVPDAKPKVVAEDLNYSAGRNENNPNFGLSSFKSSDWAGNLAFEDGRYGVGRYSLEAQTSSSNKYKLSRIDVYRKGADGNVSNLAVIPVTATNTWFDEYLGLNNKIDDTKPPIYHIGNDLMYVGGRDIESVTASTHGKSLAWLRTGHWHLKGTPEDIEGIASSGVQNPIKNMETDDADTEIVVSELDMNAKSWQMGHNIKDGKVAYQKLSDDVKRELREINLGTVTFIKGDGDQYRYVPVGTYGVDASTLDGVTLKYGTRYIDLYKADDNQIEVEAAAAMAGNKNIGGNITCRLPLGEYVFTGTVTVGGVSVPVVLQVNTIDRPTTSGKTTITLTD